MSQCQDEIVLSNEVHSVMVVLQAPRFHRAVRLIGDRADQSTARWAIG
jgi:hypothetical protein